MKRLALINAFPNAANTAELEFIARFHIACANVGLECGSVITSDEIVDYKPDAVLATHEFSRKLTGVPTIGLIWSPLGFFDRDPYRLKSLLSYDGFLPGSAATRTFLRDFQRGLGIDKPVADDLFLPTTYRTDEAANLLGRRATLCYIGVHWDGQRHNNLLRILAERGMVRLYGPPQSWNDYPDNYGGPIPFDGRSVQQTIASHGIALCLHRPEHRSENTPSMRIFEALAVGAIPICDDIKFARDHLSDCAFFVDTNQSPDKIADQIGDIITLLNERPDDAQAIANRGKAWFDANWSLEHKLTKTVLPLIEQVRDKGHFRLQASQLTSERRGSAMLRLLGIATNHKPKAQVIIRTGGRPLHLLSRAVDSVIAANSRECPLGIIIVDYANREDVRTYAQTVSKTSLPVIYVQSPPTGFRSTALWDGLTAATAPLVCHLDDDDTVFSNHYRQLAATLEHMPHANVAYSGVIRLEEEDGHFVKAPNFDGPLGQIITERRDVKFLDPFDLHRLARIDNYIQSNAWMARTRFAQSVIGSDPEMVVTEDVYLYLLMAARGPFAFSGSATAVWHWRSTSRENSMLNVEQEVWVQAGKRTMLRLSHLPFLASSTLKQLIRADSSEDELDRRDAASLPPLRLGQSIDGGVQLSRALVLERFHKVEMEGIWTSARVAGFRVNPGSDLRKSGGFLELVLIGAAGGDAGKWVEIEVEGDEPLRLDIVDWSSKRVTLPVSAGIVGDIRVILKISEIRVGDPAGDPRNLGIYLKSVRALKDLES